MNSRVAILLFLLYAVCSNCIAQQQYIITQYMFNGLALNPAYAGSHESWSLTLMSRHQWAGIEGAPTTQSLALHGPLIRNNASAAGLLLVKDKFGAIELNNVYGSYAYRISFDRGKRHLSLGLQGGFSTFNVDLSKSNLIDPDDPVFNNQNMNSFLPNFGAGIYYHSPKLYAGISLPYIFNNRLNQVDKELSKQVRHYYITTGLILPLSHGVKYKPSVMLRYVNQVPVDFDINNSLLFNDIIWFGVTYRLNDSFDFILEIQFTDFLRFGYSYDLTTSELSAVSAGSHELVLNYRFFKKHHKVYHPRHF